MSPQLTSEAGPIVWSNCSRKDITRFLDRNWGSCLEDSPSDHEFRYPELPPGAMYNVDHQCRLQYGPDAMHCAGMDEVCQTLWCKLPDNRCVTRLEPSAPGTTCAKHKVGSEISLRYASGMILEDRFLFRSGATMDSASRWGTSLSPSKVNGASGALGRIAPGLAVQDCLHPPDPATILRPPTAASTAWASAAAIASATWT